MDVRRNAKWEIGSTQLRPVGGCRLGPNAAWSTSALYIARPVDKLSGCMRGHGAVGILQTDSESTGCTESAFVAGQWNLTRSTKFY